MFQYRETIDAGNKKRFEYLSSLDRFIQEKRESAERIRAEFAKDIFTDAEKYRACFREMLGWPLTERFCGIPKTEMIPVAHSDGVDIYRITTYILGSIPFSGLLFVADQSRPMPLVVACHGGLGTPEICSGILPIETGNYHEMVHRIIHLGANVYVPQFLLWDPKYYQVPGLNETDVDSMRRSRDNSLKQLGSSITAIEIHGVERTLDFLTGQPWVDENRIGAVGLSYGGFYTLFLAAADTRIKASVSSCFFNDRLFYNWPDWVWKNSGHMFTDVEVLSLVYPRPICLQVGKDDYLFDVKKAEDTFAHFQKFAGPHGFYAKLMVFPGTHEFSPDDAPLHELMEQLLS